MKNSRRSFISKSALGVGALSTLSFVNKSNSEIDLKSIKGGLSKEGKEFWADVKNLFPTDKNDTYFNNGTCLLYTSPSPRDVEESRMPSSA